MTSSAPLAAVLQFPGSNCEHETTEVLDLSGLKGRLYRWNQWQELRDDAPDAVLLPGGFSYQDRVRAGAVAAKERIMDLVFQLASRGVPVLGICNGAQILVETGLVPGDAQGAVQASLAANHIPGRSGYLSSWIFVKIEGNAAERCPWLGSLGEEPIPLPIAHAEGRFVLAEGAEGSSALSYCGYSGLKPRGYPENPNGSERNMAGMMNRQGNVLAMMPHPERAFHMWQLPPGLPGEWGDRREKAAESGSLGIAPGPGSRFFRSLAVHFGLQQKV